MAIIQALLAGLARSAGKILNTAFGWATTMLFGKVPEERQGYLSVLAFGSVAWLIAVVGVVSPAAAALLLAFVRVPRWVNPLWIRLAMVVAMVVLPPVLGLVSLRITDGASNRGGGTFSAALRGYRFTLGLSAALLMLLLIAPILRIRSMLRRWSVEHVPLMVEADRYADVVECIHGALGTAGWKLEARSAGPMVRLPIQVVTTLAGGNLGNLIARELTVLQSDKLEALLYPSDLVISGPKAEVARARSELTEPLAFSPANLTWTKEANELENRLCVLWHRLDSDGRVGDVEAALGHEDEALRRLKLAYDEWEVLYREKLLLERRLLRTLLTAGQSTGEDRGAASTAQQPSASDVEASVRAKAEKASNRLAAWTAKVLGLLLRAQQPRTER